MELLRTGLIGTGHMGRNHARNLAEEKRFEFAGVYDVDAGQAGEVAEKYGVKIYESMRGLLEDVDAVVIAVPSSLHKEVALKAAEYGVHALVEKPLATTSLDAEIIVDTFEKKNLKLAVGHIERFNPVFRELQKLVANEEIFFVEARRYSPFSGSGRITDTSVVEDLMIHDVDLVCALLEGEEYKVTSIHGRGESVRSDQTDFATCLMDLGGGAAHAVIHASRVSQNKERLITVHTKESCVCADLLAKTLNIYRSTNLTVDLSRDNSYVQDGIVQRVYVPIEEPLRSELVSFYNAVVNGEPIAVDGRAAVKVIQICEVVADRAKRQGRRG